MCIYRSISKTDHQIAGLGSKPQANAKNQKEPFCQRTDEQTVRQIDNYSNIFILKKRDIEK